MKQRLSRSIIFWFLFVAVAIITVNLLSLYQLQRIDQPINQELSKDIQDLTEAMSIERLADLIRYYDEVLTQSARNYAFTGDKKWKKRYQSIEPKLEQTIKAAVVEGDKTDKEFFKVINNANKILVGLEQQVLELMERNQQQQAIAILEGKKYQQNKTNYQQAFDNYRKRRESKYQKALDVSTRDLAKTANLLNKITKQSFYLFAAFLLFIFLILVLFGLFLRNTISQPLDKLVSVIKKFGKQGKAIEFSSELTKRKDEIGELAVTFQNMWQDLEKTTVSRKKLEKEVQLRKESENKLKERVKEFSCLAYLAKIVEEPDISLEDILAKTVTIIPPALQYPQSACARLKYQDQQYQSKNFKQSKCNTKSDIYSEGDKVGCVEAFYSSGIEAQQGECPFLEEEKVLLKLIAERLGRIIERKRAEALLKEAEDKFRTLVDNIPGVIYRCANDSAWTMNYISDEIKDLTGYSAGDFIGNKVRNYESIIYNPDKKMVRKKIRAALEKRIAYRLDYRIVGKNNNIVWVNERGQGIYSQAGELVWLDGVIFDITLRKKAEQDLKRAIKLKSDFLSTVSHELRTPLAAIKEGINIVYDQSAGKINKEQKEFLNISKRNVDRLARLINDVLDVQKLESGKMDFNFKDNDINSIIEEVFATMKPHAGQKQLRFTLNLDKNIPPIKVDRDKLIQVITNLASNAIKFTEQGSITINSLQEENAVKVWVEDTGPGIKKEDIPKLFKTFQQLQTEKGRKTGGTGLGLAICKDIISKHHGKIWVESEVGKGSKFIFLLPIKERRT
jgi:PAS domain S-box-containing protein